MLSYKSVTVYTDNNHSICFAKFEITNGSAIPNIIEKSFYKNGEVLYSFDYKEDGSCFLAANEQDYEADIFGWEMTDSFWEGMEYYKTAQPIIPAD